MRHPIQTPVVQFGTSRFLQAHADLFIHEAAQEGQPSGPITIVASSGSAARRARLAAFSDPAGFPVLIRGLEAGQAVDRTVRVQSVVRGLDAEADWEEITRIVAEEARCIISNTAEGGFAIPDGLTVDLSDATRAPPPFYPARLLRLLAARQQRSSEPLTVLPAELVSRNGDALRDLVLGLARRSGASGALLAFIAERCVFANSLVDRIVSEALEPAGAIAEPYALWAIENRPGLIPPCRHPAIRLVDELEPIERLKLHILNLGHTVMADYFLRGGLPGDITVREMVGTPAMRAMLETIYHEEVIPGFAARNLGEEARRYVATTLERFANPFLNHRVSDIATGHPQKLERRIVAFLDWASAAGPLSAPRLRRIAQR